MRISNGKLFLAIALMSSAMPTAVFGEIRDAMDRHDELSKTNLSVDVSVNDAGYYVYTYSVESTADNTGRIASLRVDISCGESIVVDGFSPPDFGGVNSNFSEDGLHLPVAVTWPSVDIKPSGVNFENSVYWSVWLSPGDAPATDLVIVSPLPPGDRLYKLVPDPNFRRPYFRYPDLEDYADSSEYDFPWVEDWTVSGNIAGPACPGEEYPDDGVGDNDSLFLGSAYGRESEAENELLAY